MTIIFTGGGTTGHVTKNLIVMEALKKELPDAIFHYIGSAHGKEAELVSKEVAQFHAVPVGKLRRYFSLQTIPDFFRFVAGIWQAYWILVSFRPLVCARGRPSKAHGGIPFFKTPPRDSSTRGLARNDNIMVFSSGGYVALPVCIAAWLRGIPVITHETDSVPGLSNRIIGKLAKKVLLGFEGAASYFNQEKVIITGNPVSPKLFTGSRERALQKLGFSADRRVLLVMGGSQGAREINELIWQILPELVKEWQVIHLIGQGKGKGFLGSPPRRIARNDKEGYRFFDYITDDYPDFLATADLVISRAGGNALAEIAALQKPAIIIPLMSSAADHQRKGAIEMRRHNPSWTVLEQPSAEELLTSIQRKGIPPLPASGGSVGMTDHATSATQKIIEILLQS